MHKALGAISALGCAAHHWDPLLLHLFVRLLDPESVGNKIKI